MHAKHLPFSGATSSLLLYNLFVSFSLTIAASMVFLDRILLRLKIDLVLFGTVKSVMFLLPAVLYQLLTPFLRKMDRDVEICSVCYLLRCLFPLCLPFCAVMFPREWMTACCFILLPGGMIFAVFANNSLMKLYRRLLSPEKFNSSIGYMQLCLSLPALLLSLPIAWVLDRCSGLDDRAFFLVFGVLQFLTFCFEFPAIRAIRKVKRHLRGGPAAPASPSPAKRSSLRLLIQPYLNPRTRLLLILTAFHRFSAGLMMAYLTVYFLKVMDFTLTSLTMIVAVLDFVRTSLLPLNGKIQDRAGYERSFLVLASCLFAGAVLFCCFWKSPFILPLFAILTWGGLDSLCGAFLSMGESAANAKFADPEWIDPALGAYSFVENCALFAGLLSASVLYAFSTRIAGEAPGDTMRLYFLLVLPAFCGVFLTALRFSKTSAE